ncbi:flagellar basal body-associated FliL family protein [Frigidibacter oleivorans]|uniref:flagellar basal body-associated FliL family protein n=1 Tax=Frigidibacter oleivorans TaxID=2487129 RepID=UPI000F8C77FB|nr:flagellar basal body-associated FliL family protein [Frigidibacter oleivorans]
MPATATAATPSAAPADAPPRPGLVARLLKPLLRLVLLLVGAAALAGAGFAAGWFYFARPGSPVIEALRALQAPAAAPGDGSAAMPAETPADGPAEMPDAPQKMPKPLPEADRFATTYYTFAEPLTSNLAAGRRFLQVTVALSTQYDAQVMTNVETNKVALQSDMLAVIATHTQEDLAGIEGREKLAAALRDAINARLESLEGFGGVDAVWFPSFVMQ